MGKHSKSSQGSSSQSKNNSSFDNSDYKDDKYSKSTNDSSLQSDSYFQDSHFRESSKSTEFPQSSNVSMYDDFSDIDSFNSGSSKDSSEKKPLASYNPYISTSFEYEDEIPENADAIEDEPTESLPKGYQFDTRDTGSISQKNSHEDMSSHYPDEALASTQGLSPQEREELLNETSSSAGDKTSDGGSSATKVMGDTNKSDSLPVNAPAYPPADEGDNGKDSVGSGKKKMSSGAKAAWWISGVLVVVIVLGGVGGWYWWGAQRQKAALQGCVAAQNVLATAADRARQALQEARNSSAQLTSSQVVNGALITQLQQDLATPIPTPLGCEVNLSPQQLQAQANTMRDQAQQMNALIEKTQKDVTALVESQNKKALLSAQQQLKTSIGVAEQVYQLSQGKLNNSQLLGTLQQRITAAKELLDNPAATAAQLGMTVQRLAEAAQNVQQAVQTQIVQQQQQATTSSNGSNNSSNSSSSSSNSGSSSSSGGSSSSSNKPQSSSQGSSSNSGNSSSNSESSSDQ